MEYRKENTIDFELPKIEENLIDLTFSDKIIQN